MRRLLLAVPVVLALAGCALGYPGLRESNTKALASLELGMPKAQVIAAMGTTGFGDFDNPADREKFVLGSDAYEVLYYYTTLVPDGQPLDTGFTPVVLKNGVFVGSGKEFLAKIR
jgi:hypothetical protein